MILRRTPPGAGGPGPPFRGRMRPRLARFLPPFLLRAPEGRGRPSAQGRLAVDIAASGEVVCVADSAGLQVVDVADPRNPTIVGSVETPDVAQAVAVSDGVAYVAGHQSGLHVIDVEDPGNPTMVATMDTPGAAYDVAVLDDALYVADDTSGLHVIDINDPTNPTLIGSVVTPQYSAYGVAVSSGVAATADEYPAPSAPSCPSSGVAHFHTVSPVCLSKATIVASVPPGVQIKRSPSTNGDSLYFHTDIILPSKSWTRLRFHFTSPPAVARQTTSESVPIA